MEVLGAEPFVDGFRYGEGPRWHDGRLWFSDSLGDRVYSAGEAGDLRVEADVARPSGLGWLADGTLLVSTLFDAKLRYVDGCGATVATTDVSDFAFTTNDLLVAPDGRAYVDLYNKTSTGTVGSIGLISPDGAVRIAADDLAMPNGLAFLPDGTTLVVSETKGSRILAFPSAPDGSLGEAAVFADLGGGRQPDGLCVDVEGGVWVGCYSTGEFLRVLDGGTVTHRVAVDGGWAVAPALGGADGRTLYMIVDDTTIEALLAGESTGWILQTRVDIPGAGSP